MSARHFPHFSPNRSCLRIPPLYFRRHKSILITGRTRGCSRYSSAISHSSVDETALSWRRHFRARTMDAHTFPQIPVQIHRGWKRRFVCFSVTSFELAGATGERNICRSLVHARLYCIPRLAYILHMRTISIIFCAEFASNNPGGSLEKAHRGKTDSRKKRANGLLVETLKTAISLSFCRPRVTLPRSIRIFSDTIVVTRTFR